MTSPAVHALVTDGTPPSLEAAYVDPMADDPRRTLGSLGEDIAVEHLTAAGYRILERNYRTRYGEIDIIAADSGKLVFCEVKTRAAGSSHGPQIGRAHV